MRKGFTLAEVLITLVIIGVIAALTIPTLMQANKRSEVETKLKVAHSLISNAIKLSMLDNGDVDTWQYGAGSKSLFQTYFRPYLKLSKDCSEQTCPLLQPRNSKGSGNCEWCASQGNDYGAYLSNGMWLETYDNHTRPCAEENNVGCMIIAVDINGSAAPNTAGKDVFWFGIYGQGRVAAQGVPGVASAVSYATIKNNCYNVITGHSGMVCTAVIMSNGWKIPDDYPWL